MTEQFRGDGSRDAAGKPYPNEHSVKLYHQAHSGGPWPSDVIAHYEQIDADRGLRRPRLCNGYGRKGKMWDPL